MKNLIVLISFMKINLCLESKNIFKTETFSNDCNNPDNISFIKLKHECTSEQITSDSCQKFDGKQG